jgi:sugar lactone lactonase YvrE
MKDPTLLHEDKYLLAEGPLWCAERNSLFWVDIEGKTVNEFYWKSHQLKSYSIPYRVGFAVEGRQGQLILGVEGGLALLDLETAATRWLLDVEKGQEAQRCNDGKCDAWGRLWFSTMNLEAKPGAGAFYLLDQQLHLQKKSDGLSIPNGLDWSLDKKNLYHIDSPERCIKRYFFDGSQGKITFEKVVVQVPENLGLPDGMTIDEEGMLWVAHWGGWGVCRWNPENGALLTKIELPVPHVTSCAFGGEHLDHLFITTARQYLSEEEQLKYPLSGGVFVVKPGVRGLAANKFWGI